MTQKALCNLGRKLCDRDTGGHQSFPILINGTAASEQKIKSLLRMGIEVAHLSGDIVNVSLIHEAQDGTIELSKKAGNRPGRSLTGIFTLS
jgi:hypothetical protein